MSCSSQRSSCFCQAGTESEQSDRGCCSSSIKWYVYITRHYEHIYIYLPHTCVIMYILYIVSYIVYFCQIFYSLSSCQQRAMFLYLTFDGSPIYIYVFNDLPRTQSCLETGYCAYGYQSLSMRRSISIVIQHVFT